jgi:hypothetical protein
MSTSDEIAGRGRRWGGSIAAKAMTVGFGLIGALVATVIGLLTFGVQATVAPSHLPLAIGSSGAAQAPALAPLISRVTAQGGDAVDWRTVGSRAEAQDLLDRKEVYGAVLFGSGPGGLAATVLVSGAVNPSATLVAQPLLTQVAQSVTAAAQARSASGPPPLSQRAAAAPAVRIVTIHPTSAAGRTVPLAASGLLWLATMITSVVAITLGPRFRGGRPLGRLQRIWTALGGAVLGTGAVLGLARLWDASLPLGWEVAGFLAFVGLGFALLQGGVLRWLGLWGMPLLSILYLMAPAVAGQVPELLNPVYRDLLWSWTPFRFSAEAVRSLLFLGSGAPDVGPALLVFAGIALGGLVLLLLPQRHRSETAPAADQASAKQRLLLAGLAYLLVRRRDQVATLPEPVLRQLLAAIGDDRVQRAPVSRR